MEREEPPRETADEIEGRTDLEHSQADEYFDPMMGDALAPGFDPKSDPRYSEDSEEDDIGPPAPGEFDPKDYPNPELGLKC